jgi:hypothetical protein
VRPTQSSHQDAIFITSSHQDGIFITSNREKLFLTNEDPKDVTSEEDIHMRATVVHMNIIRQIIMVSATLDAKKNAYVKPNAVRNFDTNRKMLIVIDAKKNAYVKPNAVRNFDTNRKMLIGYLPNTEVTLSIDYLLATIPNPNGILLTTKETHY